MIGITYPHSVEQYKYAPTADARSISLVPLRRLIVPMVWRIMIMLIEIFVYYINAMVNCCVSCKISIIYHWVLPPLYRSSKGPRFRNYRHPISKHVAHLTFFEIICNRVGMHFGSMAPQRPECSSGPITGYYHFYDICAGFRLPDLAWRTILRLFRLGHNSPSLYPKFRFGLLAALVVYPPR